MISNLTIPHQHRRKLDGTSDLLCLRCLSTLVVFNDDGDAAIDQHICHSFFSPASGRNPSVDS
jgi:hypothetical protein